VEEPIAISEPVAFRGSSAVSSFLDRKIPRKPEVLERSKKLVGGAPLPLH